MNLYERKMFKDAEKKHLKTHLIDYVRDLKYCIQDIFKKRTKANPGNKKITKIGVEQMDWKINQGNTPESRIAEQIIGMGVKWLSKEQVPEREDKRRLYRKNNKNLQNFFFQ